MRADRRRPSRITHAILASLICGLAAGSARAADQQKTVPAAPRKAPAPAEIIGFELGTDYTLADYGQVLRYFQALDAASDRVVLEEIGRTTLGKAMVVAVISSEENLRNRERYREINRRLALGKDLGEDEARRLAKESKVTVWIDGGLHSSEVAHSQHTPELAYWLATDESEEARRIRDDVITLVCANVNPDGLDIIVNWYRKNLGTPFETAPLPGLYHHYVGHDNNRDWYMFTQAESRNVARVFYERWFPQIIYNRDAALLHGSGAGRHVLARHSAANARTVRVLPGAVERRLLAGARRDGLHDDGIARRVGPRVEAARGVPLRHLSHGPPADRARRAGRGRAVRVHHRRRRAARSRRGGRAAARPAHGGRRGPARRQTVHGRRPAVPGRRLSRPAAGVQAVRPRHHGAEGSPRSLPVSGRAGRASI